MHRPAVDMASMCNFDEVDIDEERPQRAAPMEFKPPLLTFESISDDSSTCLGESELSSQSTHFETLPRLTDMRRLIAKKKPVSKICL